MLSNSFLPPRNALEKETKPDLGIPLFVLVIVMTNCSMSLNDSRQNVSLHSTQPLMHL